MDRISTATKAVDLFGAGKHGFKNGDLANSILPTDLNAEWFNEVQEELMGVVESSGQAAAGGTLNQVTKAIKRIAGANLKTVTAGASALTVDDAGMVLVDATGGNIALTLPAANIVPGLAIGFTFYRTDSTGNTVTISRAGADTIDGVTSLIVPSQFAYHSIKGDGQSAWSTTAQVSSASGSKLFSLAASVAANALTITLNPASLDFRSSAASVGVPNTRTTTAPTSLVVPSGATLGTTNTVPARLVVIAMDNAGVVELAVINQANAALLDEIGFLSTTVMSAASDNLGVAYSTVARANLPYRVVGYVDLTQAVAGTWATAPSLVQGAGGQATATLNTLGYGQTWQNMIGSRTFTTNYTNTTGRPIMVAITGNSAFTGGSVAMSAQVAGVVVGQGSINDSTGAAFGAHTHCVSFVVPPGASYRVDPTSGTMTLLAWAELR